METTDIKIGSIVELISDPSKKGAVTGINDDSYTVFMDGLEQTFYSEQIRLEGEKADEGPMALSKVKAALTAYQINNPGSSNLYSLNSARVDFVPYQFRPALKMIKADVPRILVADDVGVGKTIEAGLVLKEAEARFSGKSVLIICPRPLVAEKKWVDEMKRFDEDFTQLNGAELAQCINDTDRDGEWPDRHRKTIIPYSLFNKRVLEGSKAKGIKGLLELDPMPQFDIVIVDEAHTIRNAETYAHKCVELFTDAADEVVFLSATPLQNSDRDLFNLLHMLRPDEITDISTYKMMTEPNGYINRLLLTIRSQSEDWQEDARDYIDEILATKWGKNVISKNPNFDRAVRLINKGDITREEKVQAISLVESLHSFDGMLTRTRRRDIDDFCVRNSETLEVYFTSEQAELYSKLMKFNEKALRMIHGDESPIAFMMYSMMRRAASCIHGLRPFLDEIVTRNFNKLCSDGELYEHFDEIDASDFEGIGLYKMAEELLELSKGLSDEDPKFDELKKILNKKKEEANNRVIIFSSFRHTLNYLCEKLTMEGFRVAQIDGDVPDEDRNMIRERFLLNRDDSDALDVLLFSEVGCEGLDYQFCDTMVNYDLPWNPMRIEQRIGRIDRRGQKSEKVRIINMITGGTIEADVHYKCFEKINIFENSIGDCAEILGTITDELQSIMLSPGISEEERDEKLEKLAENAIREIEEIRKLEEDQKELYAFDLSQDLQAKEVDDATNIWITPESISNLVETFLNDYCGKATYDKSAKDNPIRTLNISKEKRELLRRDLKSLTTDGSSSAYKKWRQYLKQTGNSLYKITYDSKTANDNREVEFLNQMHPFVQQAARYESDMLPCVIGLSVVDSELPKGDYPFSIYAWRYVGRKPYTKLIVESDNSTVKEKLLEYIRDAEDYAFDEIVFEDRWVEIDKIQKLDWDVAHKNYVQSVKEDCNYAISQARGSASKREEIINDTIMSTSDDNILKMKKRELENVKAKLADKENMLKETISKADIYTKQLVKGVLHVEQL